MKQLIVTQCIFCGELEAIYTELPCGIEAYCCTHCGTIFPKSNASHKIVKCIRAAKQCAKCGQMDTKFNSIMERLNATNREIAEQLQMVGSKSNS